ncbi:LemA family protein [Rhodococcus sp. G-MC3]|uniref:LemA family protein n=1 Tax=Rhodococcus sp. G-MC3 TaxID=3046209 RepID=UPI0024BB679E|nr:LemA family protein [Rhodococcus sp. G-MC3]MDJ0393342.1 LemA family protein [Rhodococcus sp. G-MC3]
MTVFVFVVILVLAVLVYSASVERRVRRYRSNTAASRHLVTVELERRYIQLEPFIAAIDLSGLDPEVVRQLVGARSWSKAVRDRGLGLAAQAAAENALSAAVHAVLSESDTHQKLKSNWAFQGPARDLETTEKRIAGAVRVYNDNAYKLSMLRSSFTTKFMATALKVADPEPFVEHVAVASDEHPEDVPA